MTLKPITFHLTIEDIDRYQKLIKQFPLTSEEKILNQIPKKLEAILRRKKYYIFTIRGPLTIIPSSVFRQLISYDMPAVMLR